MTDLQTVLKDGIVNVTFTKVDGTTRVMRCTLNEHIVPKTEAKENPSGRKANDAVQVVYDLDKNAWRSFRKDSVVQFNIE